MCYKPHDQCKICKRAARGSKRVLLKRGTENGTEKGTEWKTEWNGKRNESFEGKQNIWISLIQLITKEIDLK